MVLKNRAILTTADPVSRIWSIERCHFQRLWTTPASDFKVMPLLDAEYLRNGMRYRQVSMEYTHPTQQCHFR